MDDEVLDTILRQEVQGTDADVNSRPLPRPTSSAPLSHSAATKHLVVDDGKDSEWYLGVLFLIFLTAQFHLEKLHCQRSAGLSEVTSPSLLASYLPDSLSCGVSL